MHSDLGKAYVERKLKFGLESALKRLENNNKCIEFNTDRNVVNIPINKIILYVPRTKTTIVTVDEQFVVDRPYKAVKDMINSYFFLRVTRKLLCELKLCESIFAVTRKMRNRKS